MSEKCMFCGKPYRVETLEACGHVISIPFPVCDCETRELENNARLKNRPPNCAAWPP